MMRGGDAEDLDDIRFLLRQSEIDHRTVLWAIENVVLPDIEELRGLFALAREKVLQEIQSDSD
jgi:hypothetical protein